MKNKKTKDENNAIILIIMWVIGYGIGCYLRSMTVILLSSLYAGTLLACSWRIERLEKRIDFYRKELAKQARNEITNDEENETTPHITMTKGA
jgi:hypothetical protein